jgi:hypothetical protein
MKQGSAYLMQYFKNVFKIVLTVKTVASLRCRSCQLLFIYFLFDPVEIQFRIFVYF